MVGPRCLLGFGALLLVLTGCGAHAAAVHPTLHGRVDVGGYKLYIDCTGTGSPTVVLDAGYSSYSADWSEEQPGVASFTRVCSYDRAGLGKSDPRKKSPGTSDQVVKELDTLLHRAHIPGPYVLAGHSLGGMNARLYAYRHRSEVAGMVEVDAAVEGLCTSSFSGCPYGGEDIDIIASMAQVRSATHGVIKGSLGNLPLVVLSNGLGYGDGNPADDRVWQSFQKQLPGASTNSIHVVALHSDHFIPIAQPELVTQAIRDVVMAVRSRSHKVPACGLAFTRLGGGCVRP
jgi:alpha/beta hydrolase fold